jgi:hypothetical protein
MEWIRAAFPDFRPLFIFIGDNPQIRSFSSIIGDEAMAIDYRTRE